MVRKQHEITNNLATGFYWDFEVGGAEGLEFWRMSGFVLSQRLFFTSLILSSNSSNSSGQKALSSSGVLKPDRSYFCGMSRSHCYGSDSTWSKHLYQVSVMMIPVGKIIILFPTPPSEWKYSCDHL